MAEIVLTDEQFFAQYPDRQARIRKPVMTPVKNAQRAVQYTGEFEGEFWSLGAHDHDRRRVIVWRIPQDNPHFGAEGRTLMPIPFLLFSDETVEDNDTVLLPLIHNLMLDASETGGR